MSFDRITYFDQMLKLVSLFLLLLVCLVTVKPLAQDRNTAAAYIEEWKAFYPSSALDQGMHASIFNYEDRSAHNIDRWLQVNRDLLNALASDDENASAHVLINNRLLRNQARGEIDRWERKALHQTSVAMYSRFIGNAMGPVIDADFLTDTEKQQIICSRLDDVNALCYAAMSSLSFVPMEEVKREMDQLNRSVEYYEGQLPNEIGNPSSPGCDDFAERCKSTAQTIAELVEYLNQEILPKGSDANNILGSSEYARRLELYTDSDLTPMDLEKLALEEIEVTKKLIEQISQDYVQQEYPDESLPQDAGDFVSRAFKDMESDVPTGNDDYLQFWLELRDAAVSFIDENDIATLPAVQTLRITPAPESAGAAARIGWVQSASPFDPNPVTTLYLPSIPDTVSEQEQRDFWSSFNKPFNRMIVIHELFPGHYMQIKVSRETPYPERLLFPYRPYFEGWATFCEKVLLDEGWESERPLTYLAHLRKRLENANRAYTSVQVHCNGWTEEQVMEFSTETSLLAPQFAKSLWGRIMRSPMQLTSYFLGGYQFKELYEAERKRLGDAFDLKRFMDTIMLAGPIPIDEFHKVFEGLQP